MKHILLTNSLPAHIPFTMARYSSCSALCKARWKIIRFFYFKSVGHRML